MLPPEAVSQLGMGLLEISPALSFEIELDAMGQVSLNQVHPSWVRVQRCSYEEVDALIQQSPFQELYRLAASYKSRRQKNRALTGKVG